MNKNSLGYTKITHVYIEDFNMVFLVITTISSASLLSSIILKTYKRESTLSSR